MKRSSTGIKIIRSLKKKQPKAPSKKTPSKKATPKETQSTMIFAPSVNIMGPTHGVSGYETTGRPGDFSFQGHPYRIPFASGDQASRYGLQNHTANTINSFTTPTHDPMMNYSIPRPNPGNFTQEPTLASGLSAAEQLFSDQIRRSSRTLHERRISSSGPVQPSYASHRIRDGFLSNDPVIQPTFVDQSISHNDILGNLITPSTMRSRGVPVISPVRHSDMQNSGTANPHTRINLVTPSTSNSHIPLSAYSTPRMVNDSNTGTGNHPSMTIPGGLGNLGNVSALNQLNTSNTPTDWMRIAPGLSGLLPPPILGPGADIPIQPTGYTGQISSSAPQQARPSGGFFLN